VATINQIVGVHCANTSQWVRTVSWLPGDQFFKMGPGHEFQLEKTQTRPTLSLMTSVNCVLVPDILLFI
jgi:hypothetical protein